MSILPGMSAAVVAASAAGLPRWLRPLGLAYGLPRFGRRGEILRHLVRLGGASFQGSGRKIRSEGAGSHGRQNGDCGGEGKFRQE